MALMMTTTVITRHHTHLLATIAKINIGGKHIMHRTYQVESKICEKDWEWGSLFQSNNQVGVTDWQIPKCFFYCHINLSVNFLCSKLIFPHTMVHLNQDMSLMKYFHTHSTIILPNVMMMMMSNQSEALRELRFYNISFHPFFHCPYILHPCLCPVFFSTSPCLSKLWPCWES